ncbi:uncharacterized protein RSE6_04529 [Rhynchosporium secalis]|uniref:Uncharacterized protein n=1 Tax=Rhynchosporium secalis TaxID=38038 RepID=A0A1E1M5I5_RHYSE|nr:uncharacterized protein RSE6_04529 [Rhynchosporium secalis]
MAMFDALKKGKGNVERVDKEHHSRLKRGFGIGDLDIVDFMIRDEEISLPDVMLGVFARISLRDVSRSIDRYIGVYSVNWKYR